ncbi:outer membrane cobalamin receptor protein [Novosphingobium sp. AP12]|nr:outer membrane cobalamin receptor protein [Novosphingobium sp. AP12]
MSKSVNTASGRGRLALSSAALAIAVSCAFPAQAQETGEIVGQAVPPADAPMEDANAPEIIVTGLRASLESAINTKRAATVIVDAINAEDIADFPDANLAESLQRLTGVSIDRDNGEGRTITVRGLGGDFNITRLNGLMALSTSGSNDSGTSPNRSRSFDYNTFASELFNSLKVQKTASAATDEGALGANIDLQTARPFDFKGDRFAISSEGSYQKNSRAWSPRLAGLVSKKFFDDSMGLLVSFAYNKTRNELDSYQRSAGSSDYLYAAHNVHAALAFEETERVVYFRRVLDDAHSAEAQRRRATARTDKKSSATYDLRTHRFINSCEGLGLNGAGFCVCLRRSLAFSFARDVRRTTRHKASSSPCVA